jgi:hypothetical protein
MEITMEVVQVSIKKEVFENLKRLAEPLVDDTNTVIERLINHWESCPPTLETKIASIKLPKPPTPWRSTRGERFPVGAKLRAPYLHHTFEAIVTPRGIEFDGKAYNNPSSAGIAAKESIGTTGSAANTNGWNFWEMLEPTTGRWVSINTLRVKSGA